MAELPVYIINLPYRIDRMRSILEQFKSRDEFSLNFISPISHEIGRVSHWNTIKRIVQLAEYSREDFVIICEDDHVFTSDYDYNFLMRSINNAKHIGADILLGGVSSVLSLFQIPNKLLWIEGFTGLQFSIIFSKFYSSILKSEFAISDSSDHFISSASENIFLIYPYISTQAYFGYSDLTPGNDIERRVEDSFLESSFAVNYILDSQKFYSYRSVNYYGLEEDFWIPAYVINLPERKERLAHIKEQFLGKREFKVTYLKAIKHSVGAVGLWLSIRKAIKMALESNEDLIVICEDDHVFTPEYTKELLLKNIVEAHKQGCDILSGGTSGGFTYALPLTNSRYWVNHFLATQFLVIYRKFFNSILDAPFDENVTADNFLSELTCNKMVIYPFISIQKNFGYSDVTDVHNSVPNLVQNMFCNSDIRFEKIKRSAKRYL